MYHDLSWSATQRRRLVDVQGLGNADVAKGAGSLGGLEVRQLLIEFLQNLPLHLDLSGEQSLHLLGHPILDPRVGLALDSLVSLRVCVVLPRVERGVRYPETLALRR